MMEEAIRVEELSKLYSIRGPRERYRTLRDKLSESIATPFKRLRSGRNGNLAPAEVHWALKNVGFEVKPGESVGIIGRNGAGKSTLLKVLCRITEPTFGCAYIRGRVGALLEVGAGFHQELTGRENVFLNSAILGMKRKEIERKMEEIIGFSELEKFIDTPVKHYSSGMYMRLAFAVAAHLEPEILLVDEVLAVGDAAFQKKCLGKMENVANEGRTVLFVSHNMGAVKGLCERAIWLDEGSIKADGDVDEVVKAYLNTLIDNSFTYYNDMYGFRIEEVVLRNQDGERTLNFRPGDELTVEIWFNTRKKIVSPYFWIAIQGVRGRCFAANMLLDGNRPQVLEGRGCLKCRFMSLPLLPQSFSVVMAMRDSNGKDAIVPPQDVASFNVNANLEDYGFYGERIHALAPKSSPVIIPYEWIMPDGSAVQIDLRSQNQTRSIKVG